MMVSASSLLNLSPRNILKNLSYRISIFSSDPRNTMASTGLLSCSCFSISFFMNMSRPLYTDMALDFAVPVISMLNDFCVLDDWKNISKAVIFW